MNENMINLGINENMVKPILEKQIQAAILANIGNAEDLVAKMVSITLKEKVNSEGYVSDSDWSNKYDFLELMTGNAIRKATKEALKGWLEENMSLVRKMVIEEMNKPERQKSLVGAFADAVEESLSCSWRFHCDVSFTEEDN